MARFAALARKLALIVVLATMAGSLAPAQDSAPLVGLDPIRLSLDQIEAAARRGGVTVRALYDLGQSLAPVRDDIGAKLADLEPRLADLDVRLQRLGPAPAKEAPPENGAVAAERARLTQLRADLDGAVKQARLLQVRADQLAQLIAERRRSLYAAALFERSPSALDPFFWAEAGRAVPDEVERIGQMAQAWWTHARDTGGLARMGIAAIVLVSLGIVVVLVLRRWRLSSAATRAEARFGKALYSLIMFLRVALTPPLIALAVLGVIDGFGLMSPQLNEVATGLAIAIAFATLGRAAGHGVLAPDEPQRRLIAFDDAAARSLHCHLVRGSVALGALVLLQVVHKAAFGPQVLGHAISMVFALVIVALLLHMLVDLHPGEDDVAEQDRRALWVRPVAWVAIVCIAAALVAGFAELAAFIAGRVVFTVAVLGALYLLLVVSDALLAGALGGETPRSRRIAANLGVSPRRLGLFGTILSGASRALFVILALGLLIGPWEVAAADFFEAVKGIAFGFRIGELSISVAALVGAAVVFALVMLVTRVVRRWLETRLLPMTEIEPSLRLSIATVFGYVGIIVAIVLTLAQLGIDLQKIALVAGALSVGIGFGLQSIVSNFVSGLILLAERPIRVGDLISVKGEEGHVRRISVRATEIETADKVSVIVPNSELITGLVKNSTHLNVLGRIILKVTVAYDSDADRSREILMACVTEHPQVVQAPGPAVLLTAFGDNGFQFEVYCVVTNLNNAGAIKSELHFAVLRRFREAGISMPLPQRDIRIIGGWSGAGDQAPKS